MKPQTVKLLPLTCCNQRLTAYAGRQSFYSRFKILHTGNVATDEGSQRNFQAAKRRFDYQMGVRCL